MSVRQALGASPGQVAGLLLGESARLVAAGCALGTALAVLLLPTLALADRLFETGLGDPIGWGLAIAVVASVHALASAPPAIAAARTDPATALRAE